MKHTRTDKVTIEGGITHLPAEFRETATRANRAGLEGYAISDMRYGLDVEKAREAFAVKELDREVAICFEIKYEPQPSYDRINDECTRQMMLLAIAELGLSRPGWDSALRTIAKSLDGEKLYEDFQRANADRVHRDPL